MSVLRAAAAHVLVDDVEAPAMADDQAHHLFQVLRVRDGETVTVTDGEGRWRPCRAAGTDLDPTGPSVLVERRARSLTVGFAIPKQDRPEWIVQKLTEIGVDRIVLLEAERSVVRWPADRVDKHISKMRRVASEALQQSRGVWLPEIEGPVSSTLFLPSSAAAEPDGCPIDATHSTISIGPEGGWTPYELQRATTTVSVGTTVLRVETAAVVVAARLIMHAE